MNSVATMWIIGILFLGTAVVGRAIKILGNELPALTDRFARVALAVVGAAALALGGVMYIVNSANEAHRALAPGRTVTSPTEGTPATTLAPGKPVTTTNTPEVPNVSPIEKTPATTFTPGRPVTITNTTPGAVNVSQTANPPTVTADSSVVKEAAADKPSSNIRNNNGLCMDLASNELGAQVIMFTCDPKPDHLTQKWRAYGDYNIRNNNGLCMDLASNELGAPVIMFTCDPKPDHLSQKWRMLH